MIQTIPAAIFICFFLKKKFVVDVGTDSLTAASAYKLLIIVANQISHSRCIIIFAFDHFFNPVAKNFKILCRKLISVHHPLETNGSHANTQRTTHVHENWQSLKVPLIMSRPNQVLQARRGEYP